MKAGNAGSNPDGATTRNDASIALTIFLRDIGDAVFNLNTAVVGLDAIEQGYEKPSSLDISWNPADRRAAARKTRKFVLESVLVRVSEAVNQYVAALSRLPRFAHIRSSWEAPKADTSVARKITDVAVDLVGREEYLVAAAVLLVHWRNRVVHDASRAALQPEQKKLLRDHEQAIAQKYKSLSVDRMLSHFEEGRPTLKDISSLIAMTINLARKMDIEIYKCLDKNDLNAWLEHYGIAELIDKVRAETSPKNREDSIKRVFLSHAPQLWEPYQRYGARDERAG
jgi:hypothetical protein